ncbi:MAG: putative damage-inducible protein DinB [Glaciecola sp.]|jgi:uncharacterized damage-inducible protein DinB|uniref:DinB family protein n=1 Tax=Congregibacter sp. TaxID=2744308 RepID=UPI0039E43B48
MITPDYVRLMAAYTAWQNESLFTAASTLNDEERLRGRRAFFGSIQATLNHLLWGDQLWMQRLAGTAAPKATDIPSSTTQYEYWPDLVAARAATDRTMLDWAETVKDEDLEGELGWYSAAMNTDIRRPRWVLVIQLFNHGTHHRGQVHTMLTAAGVLPGDTDVPFMPAEHYDWIS